MKLDYHFLVKFIGGVVRRIVLNIVLVLLLGSCKNYRKIKDEFEVLNGDYSHKLSSSFRPFNNDKSLGYGILIVKDGVIEHAAGYGIANFEDKKAILPNSKFQSWILFNHAAKISLLKLWDEGKVDLNAPIMEYIKYLPKDYAIVKVKHIINRTSGLPNIYDIDISGDKKVKEILEYYLEKIKFEHKPGTHASFESDLFEIVCISAIIEEVTGDTIETYINREVFQVLEMNNSYVYSKASFDKEDVRFYRRRSRKLVPYIHTGWVLIGHGTTISTLEDISKFYNAIDYKEFVSDKVYKEYTSITEHTDGSKAFDVESKDTYFDGYISPAGYFAIDKNNGNRGISFNAIDEATIYLPDDGYRIFVMTNHPDGRSDNALYDTVIPAIFH